MNALKLIDLDKEGLSEYKYLLERSDKLSDIVRLASPTLTDEVVVKVNVTVDGTVSRAEIEKIFLKMNSRLGRRYGSDDIDLFMSEFNTDGTIDYGQFKNAFRRLLD